MNEARGPRLLMIEDDENDILLLTRAFRTHCPSLEIEVVMDGEEAVKRLAATAGMGESLESRERWDGHLARRGSCFPTRAGSPCHPDQPTATAPAKKNHPSPMVNAASP